MLMRTERARWWEGQACGAVVVACILCSLPYAEMGFIDDWSYVKTAFEYARTGHFVYNGWATAMLGWQVPWGALFAKMFGYTFSAVRASMLPVALASVWLFFALLVRFGISRRNAAFGALMLGLSPLFVPLAASYMTDVSGLLGLSNNAKLKQPVVWPWGMGLVLLHAFAILYRFGSLPIAPVYGDEIIINDPAIALSRGQGLIAPSFTDSPFGIDKLFAHFPPVYLYLQSIIFRWLGVSVYSMRLLTTVMSIAAVAVFVLLVHLLCKWGVAKPRTALLLAALYALSSPTIVLHRVARMESLIEFLALSSLACVLAAYFMPLQNETGGRGSKARIVHVGLLIARCFLAGLCLATHPEAITAILPIALLVLLTPSLQIGTRIAITTTIALIPTLIWVIAYGSHSAAALREMITIGVENTPAPSIFRFAEDLLSHGQLHGAVMLILFCLCLIAWLAVLLRALESYPHRSGERKSGGLLQGRATVNMAMVISVPLILVLLLWFIPASITRYEVMYPIYLAGIAVSPPEKLGHWPVRRLLTVLAGLIIIVQIVVTMRHLQKDGSSADSSPNRYDAIVESLPRCARIASSPQL